MPELDTMFIRQRKYILYLLSIYILGAAFTPYDTIFQGLMLGTMCSLINFWSMVKKNRKFTEAAVAGRKMKSLGSVTRMSVGALAAVIALQYPDKFQIASVVMGLMTAYFVIMIDYFIQILRR
ncbi:ATP synthase subunit I [Peribacillus asahii]|uniref:ATP synthase subunit I n=1 Tax=Peribacillus asahii TaxID=228899 RepID=UPI0038298690